MSENTDLEQEIKEADLRYIPQTSPGITRKKNGKSFRYFDSEGKQINSETIISRIDKLAIPPAWENVWICPSPTGYLQAVGFDDKGRKQYIYHQIWTEVCQKNKFDKVTSFGKALAVLRQKVYSDMNQEDLSRERILATVVWLLDHTLIRVGNEEYAQENDSFGLTTLRHRHVRVRGKNIKFEFVGKSGIKHTVSIAHPGIAKTIKECIELPGYEIFQYFDDSDKKCVDSSDVNQYLKSVTGEDVTAKDFRTWGGTTLAGETLYQFGSFDNPDIAKKNIIQAVKKVSQHLRNTATVCRSYYIHPKVVESYNKQTLIPHFKAIFSVPKKIVQLSKSEYAVLTLLGKHS